MPYIRQRINSEVCVLTLQRQNWRAAPELDGTHLVARSGGTSRIRVTALAFKPFAFHWQELLTIFRVFT